MGATGGVRLKPDPSVPVAGRVREDEPGPGGTPGDARGPGRSRSRRRLATAVGVATLAVVMFLVGGLGVFRHPAGPPAPGREALGSDPAGSLAAHPVVMSGSLQQAIAGLQERLRVVPEDWGSWATLGLAYVQQARVTADPSYYPKAEGALRRSLAIHPNGNVEALTGEGALAAARHDFAGALGFGEQAKAIDPYDANVRGVIGDAEIELGRYRQGFATFQRMVDLKPDLSSYARASYARELQGDVPGAIRIMRLAFDSAGTPEDRAFAAYQLGELEFNRGNPGAAAREYRLAAASAPEYVPPQAGLAKVAWARGDLRLAERRYTAVVQRVPFPEYVIALGDLYATTGRAADAAREYALVRAEERLFRAAGVNVDLELALFDADHGDPARAVAEARTEWARRRSILVADALSWALFRDGKAAAARPYSRFARKLGYRSALISFHAGMIERALGLRAAARRDLQSALDTNPHFSILYSAVARRALAGLGGRV
jgi:tetratricopeptide (TPR) repeat protein